MSRRSIEGRAKALSVLIRNNEALGYVLEECILAYIKSGGEQFVNLTVTIQDRHSPGKVHSASGLFDLHEPEE